MPASHSRLRVRQRVTTFCQRAAPTDCMRQFLSKEDIIMNNSIEKFIDEFDKLERKELKNLGFSYVEKQFKEFEACYARCLKLEEELVELLPGARERGINGSDDKAFRKDPLFSKKYKEYDKSVDDIDKAEKEAFVLTNAAAASVADLGSLLTNIHKAFPKSKDMKVQLLLKRIEKSISDLRKATDIYDVRGKHKKMREYSSKFDKKVAAIIDQAPPAENPSVDLPDELGDKEMTAALKTADAINKSINECCKKIESILNAAVPYSSKADRLIIKQIQLIDLAEKRLRKQVDDYEELVKKLGGALKISLMLKAQKDYKGKFDVAQFMTDLKKATTEAKKNKAATLERITEARKNMA
jgi:hypothetical protein